MQVVLVERTVLERVAVVAGLLQVAVGERVLVDDEDPARREVVEVRLQCRRIHGDEDVRRIAGREDVVVGEVELEARHSGQRASRSSDLGREIGERGEIVAEHRRLGGESAPCQLHPVAGVPGEPDHDRFELLDRLRGHA